MQHFKNILPYTLIVILLLTQSCNDKKRIIEQDKLSLIISQMYLADQYIENNPKYRAQSDTMRVYSSILRKYGYTGDDYYNSVKYYIQKGNTYKKIHANAREILVQREDELRKLIDIKRGISIEWWATDTIKKMPVKDLYEDTYLRSIKWITMPTDTVIWKIHDSSIIDIPQNKLWWQNNLNLVFNDSIVNMYNILTKEYNIKLQRGFYNTGEFGNNQYKNLNPDNLSKKIKLKNKPINKEVIKKMEKQMNNSKE